MSKIKEIQDLISSNEETLRDKDFCNLIGNQDVEFTKLENELLRNFLHGYEEMKSSFSRLGSTGKGKGFSLMFDVLSEIDPMKF